MPLICWTVAGALAESCDASWLALATLSKLPNWRVNPPEAAGFAGAGVCCLAGIVACFSASGVLGAEDWVVDREAESGLLASAGALDAAGLADGVAAVLADAVGLDAGVADNFRAAESGRLAAGAGAGFAAEAIGACLEAADFDWITDGAAVVATAFSKAASRDRLIGSIRGSGCSASCLL